MSVPRGLGGDWLRQRSSEGLGRTQLAGLLLGAMTLVVGVRVWVPYDEVFRDAAVVLAGNDPYFYRFWVDRLLETGGNPLHPMDIAQMPERIRQHDVMMVWAVWLVAWLLGGGAGASGLVLAWYPVGGAIVTAVLLYLLVMRVWGDRRVASLAVVLLAVTPAHAYRTMLGFGDHHAFDYVALMLTATALVWLVSLEGSDGRPWRRRSWWVAAGLLGGAVAAQTLGWRGGPMLLVPLAVYAFVVPPLAIRNGRSPVIEASGLIAGLGIAAVLAGFLHLGPNWAPAFRGFAPLLLLSLVVAAVGVGEIAYRYHGSWWLPVVNWPVVLAGWLGGILALPPSFGRSLYGFQQFLAAGFSDQPLEIGEAASLLGPVQVPLELFGLILVAALPAMVWGVGLVATEYRPARVVTLVYVWYFLALSVNRIRFTGFLAMFTAAFAAIAIMYLIDTATGSASRSPGEALRQARSTSGVSVPNRRRLYQAGRILAVVVLLSGIGLAQLPGTADQITYDDTEYETASWMAGYADQREWTYPRNYVFSEWGSNRFYNYMVSGESESYSYARQNYRRFASSDDPRGWYEALEGATGFIVLRTSRFAYPADSMQVRLNQRFGSAGEGVGGVAHYRLVYRSQDGVYTVFTLVPGARIVGNASQRETVEVRTTVTVDDTAFNYRRSVRTEADGGFEVIVPYPGEYSVGGETVSVTDENVTSGDVVSG